MWYGMMNHTGLYGDNGISECCDFSDKMVNVTVPTSVIENKTLKMIGGVQTTGGLKHYGMWGHREKTR